MARKKYNITTELIKEVRELYSELGPNGEKIWTQAEICQYVELPGLYITAFVNGFNSVNDYQNNLAKEKGFNSRYERQKKGSLKEFSVKLNGAYLNNTNLSGTDLKKADLTRTDLTYSNLIRADLREVKLRDANLVGASVVEANLKKADLEGMIIDDGTFHKDGTLRTYVIGKN